MVTILKETLTPEEKDKWLATASNEEVLKTYTSMCRRYGRHNLPLEDSIELNDDINHVSKEILKRMGG